jgi:hypothetical protein
VLSISTELASVLTNGGSAWHAVYTRHLHDAAVMPRPSPITERMTVEQFEAELTSRLKTFILDPEVSVMATEFARQDPTRQAQPESLLEAIKQ